MRIEKSFLTIKYTKLWDSIERPTVFGKICNWFQYQYFNFTHFCCQPVTFHFVTKKETILKTFSDARVQCHYMERFVAPIGYDIIWFKAKDDYITAKLVMNDFFVEMDIKDELDEILRSEVRKELDKKILEKLKKNS